MTEKRQHERSPIELAASFGIPPDERVSGVTRDVSVGGLCIISAKKLKVDEIIEISIELEDDQSASVEARVCWCEPHENDTFRVGVQVQESDTPDYQKFRQIYLNQKGE